MKSNMRSQSLSREDDLTHEIASKLFEKYTRPDSLKELNTRVSLLETFLKDPNIAHEKKEKMCDYDPKNFIGIKNSFLAEKKKIDDSKAKKRGDTALASAGDTTTSNTMPDNPSPTSTSDTRTGDTTANIWSYISSGVNNVALIAREKGAAHAAVAAVSQVSQVTAFAASQGAISAKKVVQNAKEKGVPHVATVVASQVSHAVSTAASQGAEFAGKTLLKANQLIADREEKRLSDYYINTDNRNRYSALSDFNKKYTRIYNKLLTYKDSLITILKDPQSNKEKKSATCFKLCNFLDFLSKVNLFSPEMTSLEQEIYITLDEHIKYPIISNYIQDLIINLDKRELSENEKSDIRFKLCDFLNLLVRVNYYSTIRNTLEKTPENTLENCLEQNIYTILVKYINDQIKTINDHQSADIKKEHSYDALSEFFNYLTLTKSNSDSTKIKHLKQIIQRKLNIPEPLDSSSQWKVPENIAVNTRKEPIKIKKQVAKIKEKEIATITQPAKEKLEVKSSEILWNEIKAEIAATLPKEAMPDSKKDDEWSKKIKDDALESIAERKRESERKREKAQVIESVTAIREGVKASTELVAKTMREASLAITQAKEAIKEARAREQLTKANTLEKANEPIDHRIGNENKDTIEYHAQVPVSLPIMNVALDEKKSISPDEDVILQADYSMKHHALNQKIHKEINNLAICYKQLKKITISLDQQEEKNRIEETIALIEKHLRENLAQLEYLMEEFRGTPHYKFILIMHTKVAIALVDQSLKQMSSENTAKSKHAVEELKALKKEIEAQPIQSRSQLTKDAYIRITNALYEKEDIARYSLIKEKNIQLNMVLNNVLIKQIDFWHNQLSYFSYSNESVMDNNNPAKSQTVPTGIGKMISVLRQKNQFYSNPMIGKLTEMKKFATEQLNTKKFTRSEHTRELYEIFRGLDDINSLCNNPRKLEAFIKVLDGFNTKIFYEKQKQSFSLKRKM